MSQGTIAGREGRDQQFDPSQTEVIEATRPVRMPRTLGDLVPKALGALESRATGLDKPIALPWANVGKRLGGGWWPGVYVLVGNSGTGRTQWALQAALYAAKDNKPVVYVGLDLGEVELTARVLGLAGKRPWGALYVGKAEEQEWVVKSSAKAAQELTSLPFHFATGAARGFNYRELEPLSRAVRELHKSERMLVVVDSVQQIAGEVREDMRDRVANLALSARAVARDLGATVLLISDSGRASYELLDGVRGPGRPGEAPASNFVGLGKETSDLEQASDGVLVLLREMQGSLRLHLALAKLRAMAPSWAELWFDGCRFEEEKPSATAKG
ncbi:MAG: AAA family ATPase [Deltaproteobacteria bacterium]|nr:AAA family ATPase [Deltaproteobacteria bacterium]